MRKTMKITDISEIYPNFRQNKWNLSICSQNHIQMKHILSQWYTVCQPLKNLFFEKKYFINTLFCASSKSSKRSKMNKEIFLHQLEEDLPDIPKEVISEIIKLRIAFPRQTQKSIVEHFGIPKASAKKIIDRIKKCNFHNADDDLNSTKSAAVAVSVSVNCGDNVVNADKSTASDESGDDCFSSVDELMKFCNSARNSRAGTPSNPAALSLSLMTLLNDHQMDDISEAIPKKDTEPLHRWR